LNRLGFDPVIPDCTFWRCRLKDPAEGRSVLDVIGIIQARLSSSRLPGKMLAPLAGRPLLAVLARRLASARVAEWWLATTHERDDDVTAACPSRELLLAPLGGPRPMHIGE
jgi:hypothetical protein